MPEHDVHPVTDSPEPIHRPFAVGLRNTAAGMVPVLIGGLAHLVNYRELRGFVAWWVLVAVPLGIAAVAFGHAYLGRAIGGRRANNVFMILLMIVLSIGLWWLTHAQDRR